MQKTRKKKKNYLGPNDASGVLWALFRHLSGVFGGRGGSPPGDGGGES
jgi:hypothetical protein